MSEVTKPILLDETGKEIARALGEITDAIKGNLEDCWIISFDKSSSNSQLQPMRGNINAWKMYRSKLGRYLLKNDGTAKKLNRFNSAIFEDGTPVDESLGNIHTRLPRLYYKVVEQGNTVDVFMSEREISGGKVFNGRWPGSYLGAVVDGKLVSRSGLNPTRSLNINQFWNYAQAQGANFGIIDYETKQMMMLIYACEFLNLNSQAQLGLGMTGNGNNWCDVVTGALTGDTKSLGDVCGKIDFTAEGQLVTGACHVSLFGIEDPYAWFWEMVQGIYFGSANNPDQDGSEAFLYMGNRMPSSEELATHPASAYRQFTRPTSEGWLGNIIFGPFFDVFPATLNGSSSSFWGDYHYANNVGQLCLWGGTAAYGSAAGLACSRSDDGWSAAYSSVGARLAYYGNVTIE